jgi:hypothetical protein
MATVMLDTEKIHVPYGVDESKIDREVWAALDVISRKLNYGGRNTRETVRAWVGAEHRTLQQLFLRNVVKGALEAFAEMHENGWTDARNQGAAEFGKRALEANADTYLPFI